MNSEEFRRFHSYQMSEEELETHLGPPIKPKKKSKKELKKAIKLTSKKGYRLYDGLGPEIYD